jgi:ATP-dependent Clp protease ATP-binding subunit ClpX
MLDVMYEIPSSNNIREVVVNEDTISQGFQPVVVYENEATKEAS